MRRLIFAIAVVLDLLIAPIVAQGEVNDFNVWINEFHYDNTGFDTGEFVEVVAPSSFTAPGSINLTLYDGATGLSYDQINLANSDFTATPAGEFTIYTLNLPTNGLENGSPDGIAGSPDGIALTSVTNGVLQFLSYEGAFMAVDGPAGGSNSTDIGVFEPTTTPIGHSLQLSGNGNSYADFTGWSGPAANTAGALNTGQTFAPVTLSETPSQTTATNLIITGIIDGPLTGGASKAIELFAVNDIADLSIYGFESAQNGAVPDGSEFTLSGSATAGEFLYISASTADAVDGFMDFFGFAPDLTTSDANIDGDDAILLYLGDQVIDSFGEAGIDGTGEPWEYTDGWAYRVSETGPDGETFVFSNWIFSGTDALDGESTNAGAAVPFPIGTFQPAGQVVPEPTSVAIWSLLGIAVGLFMLRRNRR